MWCIKSSSRSIDTLTFRCVMMNNTRGTHVNPRTSVRGKSSVIGDVVEEESNQMVSLSPSRYNLRANICGIIVGGNVASKAFAHSYRFPNCMIADRIGFLLQYGLGSLCVVDNRHVIAINKRRARDCHSHHP